MNPLSASNLFKLVREIDLSAIQRESERRFRLLLLGDEALTSALAESLSGGDGRTGVHPWLERRGLGAPGDLSGFDLALLVRGDVEHVGGNLEVQLGALHKAHVPVVTIVVSPTAESRAGAELPREGEAARVLLPDTEPGTITQKLAPALFTTAPDDLRLALARGLPPLRAAAMRALIEETARANALYTASTGLAAVVPVLNVPLGVADMVVLTKNQLVMAYKLALAGGKGGRPQEVVGEIVSVLGGGFFFRQLARELVGFVPVAGILPNIAVSYAGTWLIGQSVQLWVLEGKKLKVNEMRRFYDVALEGGRALAQGLLERARKNAPGGERKRARLPWRLPQRGPKASPTPDSEETAQGAVGQDTTGQNAASQDPASQDAPRGEETDERENPVT